MICTTANHQPKFHHCDRSKKKKKGGKKNREWFHILYAWKCSPNSTILILNSRISLKWCQCSLFVIAGLCQWKSVSVGVSVNTPPAPAVWFSGVQRVLRPVLTQTMSAYIVLGGVCTAIWRHTEKQCATKTCRWIQLNCT